MGAKRQKSRKRSSTKKHYRKQLKRTPFFLERSFGGKLILEELRKAGVKVEPHSAQFRHDTPDPEWLVYAGQEKLAVLMRDKKIGRRTHEREALLQSGVKAFALVQGGLKDKQNAEIIIKAMPKMIRMIAANNCAFIARVHKNSRVEMWIKR